MSHAASLTAIVYMWWRVFTGAIVFFINASDPDGPDSNLRLRLDSNNFNLLSNGSVQLIKNLNYEVRVVFPWVLVLIPTIMLHLPGQNYIII